MSDRTVKRASLRSVDLARSLPIGSPAADLERASSRSRLCRVTDQLDVVVIGSGTGGYVARDSRRAARPARPPSSNAQPSLGGTCLNWGCIPTKALLEHAHALKIAQDAAEWGISFGKADVKPTIDMARVHARKNKIVTGLTKGVEFLFKKNKIEWIKGTGRLAGSGPVEVHAAPSRARCSAREIIVATGSAPRSVPGIEIDQQTASSRATKRSICRQVPKSIAIMGSGAVGVEFASIFRRFGSEVTLIELLPRLVPNEDEAVSAELEKAFKKRGITVRTGTKVTARRRSKAAASTIEMHDARRQARDRSRSRSCSWRPAAAR